MINGYFEEYFLLDATEIEGWLAAFDTDEAYDFAERIGKADDEIMELVLTGCLDAPLNLYC